MVRMRKMRVTGCISCLLIFILQLAPATQVFAAKALPVPSQRVLVMPFATGSDVADATLGVKTGHTLAAVLKNNPGFDIVDYSKRHPSLQRAVLVEHTILETALNDPSGAENLDLAAKIAREVGADMVIIGDIDSYKYDSAANTCAIQMTAQLVNSRSGRVEKTVVKAGEVPKTAKVVTESDCAAVAAGDAINKIIDELAMKPPATTVIVGKPTSAPEPKRKSKKNTLLYSIILGLGVGLVMNGGGSSGGGGGGGGIPPDPPIPPIPQ